MSKLSQWVDPNSATFNRIEDGANVDAATTNAVIEHIKQNLLYLYGKVSNLEEDRSLLAIYDAPIVSASKDGEARDKLRPGTPVAWIATGAAEGYWTTAQVSLLNTVNSSPDHWSYAQHALASGVVLRRHENSIDVALSGNMVLPVYGGEDSGYSIGQPADDGYTNDLDDLFVTSEDKGDGSSFGDGGVNPESFLSGVYYLSNTPGKLAPRSQYTRVMANIFVEPVLDDAHDYSYQLRFMLAPEGFAGERFHTHNRVSLDARLGVVDTEGGDIFNYESKYPGEWTKLQTGESGRVFLDIYADGTHLASNFFPYSELTGAVPGAPDAENAELLYDSTQDSKYRTGWLPVSDTFFTSKQESGGAGFAIPDNAIWGFTVDHHNTLATTTSTEFWSPPADIRHVVLTRNGVPVPSSYYVIDTSGIWWVKKGCEHAPINEIGGIDGEGYAQGDFELWYIDYIGESDDSVITQVHSESLIVNKEDGNVGIEDPEHYFRTPMTPVIPFNTMDAFDAATKQHIRDAVSERIVTPELLKYGIEYFSALTKTDLTRSLKPYTDTWNSLKTSGLYVMSDLTNAPATSSTSGLLGFVGASGHNVFQFCFDTTMPQEAHIRIGRGNEAGDDTEWAEWIPLTDRQSYIDLPGGDSTTTVDFRLNSSRILISADEEHDTVVVPTLDTGAEYNEYAKDYLDGLEISFANEMISTSISSVLAIKLTNKLTGTKYDYLVSAGQSGDAAYIHMGLMTPPADTSWAAHRLLSYDSDNRVMGDCLAPQAYGGSVINLKSFRGSWIITGGSGIWFGVTAAEWEELIAQEPVEEEIYRFRGLLDKLIKGKYPVIKLSAIAHPGPPQEASELTYNYSR